MSKHPLKTVIWSQKQLQEEDSNGLEAGARSPAVLWSLRGVSGRASRGLPVRAAGLKGTAQSTTGRSEDAGLGLRIPFLLPHVPLARRQAKKESFHHPRSPPPPAARAGALTLRPLMPLGPGAPPVPGSPGVPCEESQEEAH